MILHFSNQGIFQVMSRVASSFFPTPLFEVLPLLRSRSSFFPLTNIPFLSEEAPSSNLRELSLGNLVDSFHENITKADDHFSFFSPHSAPTGWIPPAPPILLLEGDQYCFSLDGVARTLYQLRTQERIQSSAYFSVEEQYDVKNAKKRFLFRRSNETWGRDKQSATISKDYDEGTIVLGRPIQKVDLQEIAAGAFERAGTGATTWESSIVMSIYFASHPELLQGDVVELGCGVGLGGILCAMASQIIDEDNEKYTPTQSINLTDFNPFVMEQCQKNVDAIDKGTTPITVFKLDWYDFLPTNFERPSSTQKFDTVIACDCAYRQKDIAALACTMRSLLRDDSSQVHVFGPSNRSGLDTLLTLLRNAYNLSVTVEELGMIRYRLRPAREGGGSFSPDRSVDLAEECQYATCSISNYLHIICSRKASTRKPNESMSDID